MLVRIAKRLNPDLGLHCLPLHFWQKINAWKLSTFTIDLCRVKSRIARTSFYSDQIHEFSIFCR